LLASISDSSPFDPPSAYRHALRTFANGRLEAARLEADRGYRQSLAQDPDWVKRFQILEARAMAWSGLNTEVLELFAQGPLCVAGASPCRPKEEIEQESLEATALMSLGRTADADRILSKADTLCAGSSSVSCGQVVQTHGVAYLYSGQLEQARQTFLRALDLARLNQDKMFEATVLLNLASTLSRQERHDEAVSLARRSYRIATQFGEEDIAQTAVENEGWEFYSLGNPEKALELYMTAQKQAASLGDKDGEAQFLTLAALAYADLGQLDSAESFDLRAIKLAKQIDHKDKIINASEDLAHVYLHEGKTADAERHAGEAESLARKTGSLLDVLYCHMLQGEAAALRHDWPRADSLLHEVAAAPESQTRMRWTAQHTLATMYEAQGQAAEAEQSYKAALALVEGARADLKQELSQLTFLTNAARIYDDYIHFLVAQGRSDEALEAADWSRARTLQQGLGLISADASLKPPPLRAREIARRTNATLLFYWMGERQSYLWAVSPEKTTLVNLPPKSDIITRAERYRRTLLALKDPLRENNGQGDKDGRELYAMLVAPVADAVAQRRPVILFTDGEISELNFETLLVTSPSPHYWIEDATVSSAPSIRLLAARERASASAGKGKLLLLGNALSSDPALPHLPMAELEVHKVEAKFNAADERVFSGARATPLTYLASKPEQFSYIHFVAHGTASNTDPLESAVILSRDNPEDRTGEDSYKLYARDILRHPISARLVTISACNSSGTRSYAGEGMVGLSWAFLRAGAHNTIGALWDVSDASTPELMDHLYTGLQQNKTPAAALREAKLSLLHSGGTFSRPFYWAPFQLYSGH
jgi:CHAT domain-containing protein